MTSKHYRWQARWRHDAAAGLWVHDTGLRVQPRPGAPPAALNATDTLAALVPTHGPHNAPAMLRRLLREAHQLATTPQAQPAP